MLVSDDGAGGVWWGEGWWREFGGGKLIVVGWMGGDCGRWFGRDSINGSGVVGCVWACS